jgi:pimeloyl-ACP methyl ester carboxylesterase
MARDVVALIEHPRLVAVDVIGFSMGAGTAARLLILRPPQVSLQFSLGSGTTPSKTQFWSFRKTGRFPIRGLAR